MQSSVDCMNIFRGLRKKHLFLTAVVSSLRCFGCHTKMIIMY